MPSVLVYLVDDDRLALRRLAGAVKTHTGHQVVTFHTPEDLLIGVEKRAPDVVLADYKMPDMDGLSLLAAVRERVPHIVGIVMATYGDQESMRAVLDALGPLRVVNKPCDMIDLDLKIRAGIERRDLERKLDMARGTAQAAAAKLATKQREAATATERLVEAEQLAAVGRVVSGIANEIGGQLALVGYAEAIKARVADDPELSEFADVIVTAQKRLASMVDEIRDFVAAEQRERDGRSLSREPSDVGGVVDEALSIMRYDRDVRDRKIEKNYKARPLASLDRQKFSQVIINLVSNAALATKPGDEIVVEIDARDANALVSVIDRGCGMSPEVVERLGEPFFSAREDRGSGLGVGICKRIIERHGGTLTFQSTAGKGTRATASVPLLEDAT